ncbi:MAG: hypothetical protein PHC97_00055 [Patescibacteria group bacterium]|nr:hypothetical protein [Patescibacteria group bacterium]
MTKIKSLDVLSVAKVEGLLGVILGLVLGILFALVGAGISGMLGDQGGWGMMGGGLFAIILMPIMYGIGGFISGAIVAWLYNLVAGWIGGIGIELENK